jgi:hypothetical protein
MSVNNEQETVEDNFDTSLEEAKKKKMKAKDREEEEEGEEEEEEDEDGHEQGWSKSNKKSEVYNKKQEKLENRKKKPKMMDEEIDEDLEEETLAASSLHPAARSISDPKALSKSKIGMMQHMMGVMNGMSKGDLTDWFHKTISQFGPNKTYGVGDNSGKNQSSIDMHPSDAVSAKGPKTKNPMPKLNVKEDVDAMFEGQELSEEFKDNVATLFEAAVNARIIAETAALEEAYAETLEEEISEFKEQITSKIDTYLDYVVEEWMKENQVAIESTLRNEIMEEFIEGLKNLFAEHYIDVPQEKIEVIESLADKVEELETKLDETISENVELRSALTESFANDIFEELSADLALTQQEKFKALAEGIEFDGDLDVYTKKLKIIKENYFKQDRTSNVSNIIEESFEGEVEHNVNVDPSVNRYVQALTRTVKK